MKRRYKPGHWIRVPLAGAYDALAIITQACRSRLFGYFFAVPSGYTPAMEELKVLRARDALAAMLFGGAPIEDGRWEILATSLAFDADAWPFPDFASRGAFGRTWTRVRYDPATMQIVERAPIEASAAAALPDARFADERHAEALLRRRIRDESDPRARSVVEVRSPIDPTTLRSLDDGARVQFSTPLSTGDLDRLANAVRERPNIALRVHGFAHGFDAGELSRFDRLRDLTLDVTLVQHADELGNLLELRSLRFGRCAVDLTFTRQLPLLRTLELRGTRVEPQALRNAANLRELHLENTLPVDVREAPCATTLEKLVLAHGYYDVAQVESLPAVRRLEFRSLNAQTLPHFDRLRELRTLVVCDLPNVRDLAPIALAPVLRDLHVWAMPQLCVEDFAPFAACARLRVHVDIGSRRKEREIYRLLRSGNKLEV